MRSEKEMMDSYTTLFRSRGHAQILIYLRTNSRIMMSHTS